MSHSCDACYIRLYEYNVRTYTLVQIETKYKKIQKRFSEQGGQTQREPTQLKSKIRSELKENPLQQIDAPSIRV